MTNQSITTIKISRKIHDKIKLVSNITGVTQKQFVEQSIINELRNYEEVVKKIKEKEKKQLRL